MSTNLRATSSGTSEPNRHLLQDGFTEDTDTCLHNPVNDGPSLIKAKIASAASLNSELLVTLESTSEAPAALGHISTHISILRDEVLKQDRIVQEIVQRVALQLKRHRKFRDSIAKRFTYHVTYMGKKFEARAMMEENTYIEAVQEQSKAEDRRSGLQSKLSEAAKEQTGIAAAAKKHEKAHAAIDNLYESIFAGPTPGFAEEDEREQKYKTRWIEHKAVRHAIKRNRRAVQSLAGASGTLDVACGQNRRAQEEEDSLFLAVSTALSYLANSNHYISLTRLSVDQARGSLECLDASATEAHRSLLGALRAASTDPNTLISQQVVFVRAAEAGKRLAEAKEFLNVLAAAAKQKEKRALEKIKDTAREFEDARQALQQIRQAAFEQVVGFGAAPPGYHECCDRAQGFAELPVEEPQGDGNRELDGLVFAPIREGANLEHGNERLDEPPSYGGN